MTLFDLLFILAVFAALGGVSGSLATVLRGDKLGARRWLKWVGIGSVVYLGTVTLTSGLLPRRALALDQDLCSDDWCIAVTSITARDQGADLAWEVGFRISSRAKRVRQREKFVVPYVLDGAGRRHDAVARKGEAAFDMPLEPGQAIPLSRTFLVPAADGFRGVVIAREGDLGFPRCCILGQGLLRRPPVVLRP